MERETNGKTSEPAPPKSRPRVRSRWWVVGLGASLLVAEMVAKSRSGMPFAVSVLDGLVLVALAVVAGTYVILARADREASAEREERDATAD